MTLESLEVSQSATATVAPPRSRLVARPSGTVAEETESGAMSVVLIGGWQTCGARER